MSKDTTFKIIIIFYNITGEVLYKYDTRITMLVYSTPIHITVLVIDVAFYLLLVAGGLVWLEY